MDYSSIAWQRQDEIGILKFNSPETYNSLSSEMHLELFDLLPRLKEEKDLRAVIITGEGKSFSSGGDMALFLKMIRNQREQGGVGDVFSSKLAKAILAIEIPVIAAVNGPAIGAGFTLSLICDIRIASKNAAFGAVFAQVGLTPEYASSFLLSRIVGLTKACEMMLTARIIDAQEALTAGLVSEVTSRERLMPRAEELARKIATLPPIGVRTTKRVLRHGLSATLEQAIEYEELAETYCMSSLDHEEAIKAFVEKRKPKFIGR
ncbi:MAG: enoyl-CoA hydratase/isomerase family protein [Deltaproteobacteria bacterium]|nr:enoyl-CoA hydratase/isomerase family protein [Deltaproteobacteria bacterium]